MVEHRRRIVGRVLLGSAALWASLAIVFVLTGGGDRESVQMLITLGVAVSAGHLSGEWERYDGARRLALGEPPSPSRSFRRLAVLAAVGAVLLAITVLALTPRSPAVWVFGATVWAAGFASLAAADALARRTSRRRLYPEAPSPGSTGYPSR